MRLGVALVRVTGLSTYWIDNGLREGVLSLSNNVPNFRSRRWGKVTGRRTGGGFRAFVRARHAVPLCGEGVWVGCGVVFFEGGSGMNEGCPPGDDDLDRGCNGEGWL